MILFESFDRKDWFSEWKEKRIRLSGRGKSIQSSLTDWAVCDVRTACWADDSWGRVVGDDLGFPTTAKPEIHIEHW